MKIAIQMNHIKDIDITGDTTFELALAAQERGCEIYHYTPDRLSQINSELTVKVESLAVYDVKGAHYKLGAMEKRSLDFFDVILLRQDPPFDMNYITNTHFLDVVADKCLVVNDPFWVRNSPEKLFVMQFKDLMPETLITEDKAEVLAFRERHGDIIIKPLYGNGGAGVFLLKEDDPNLSSLLELFGQIYNTPYIVQRYLPAVRSGDKRIILLDGEPVGAINRVAAHNETRSNLHVGGRAEAVELTDADRMICDRLRPFMVKRGFLLVGIDIIGDKLTEINVTSPTGIRQIKQFGGNDIAAMFWDKVEERLKDRGV